MTVWVVSGIPIERALIVAELEEEGLEAQGCESLTDLRNALSGGRLPEAFIVDAGVLDSPPEEGDVLIHLIPPARTILIAGALTDQPQYVHSLRRPVSIGDLVAKTKALIGGTL